MTIKQIQLHQASDGSSHATLKEAQKHNSNIKLEAFHQLCNILNSGFYLDDMEGQQASDFVLTLISNKDKIIKLLKLL